MRRVKKYIRLPLTNEEQFIVDELIEAERMKEQHEAMAKKLAEKIEILNNIRKQVK